MIYENANLGLYMLNGADILSDSTTNHDVLIANNTIKVTDGLVANGDVEIAILSGSNFNCQSAKHQIFSEWQDGAVNKLIAILDSNHSWLDLRGNWWKGVNTSDSLLSRIYDINPPTLIQTTPILQTIGNPHNYWAISEGDIDLQNEKLLLVYESVSYTHLTLPTNREV